MTFLGGADIAEMLKDLAAAGGTVDVVFGSTTVYGILDKDAVEIFGEEMPPIIGADEVVQVQSGAFTDLVPGSSLTVGGVSYKALKGPMPYGDGAMVRIPLRNP